MRFQYFLGILCTRVQRNTTQEKHVLNEAAHVDEHTQWQRSWGDSLDNKSFDLMSVCNAPHKWHRANEPVCADCVCFGLFRCVWGAITIHQCCAGMELHKRLKVDTSREAQWDQAKTAHSSRVLIPEGNRGPAEPVRYSLQAQLIYNKTGDLKHLFILRPYCIYKK